MNNSEQGKCNGNCGMNYCDEYGCIENKPEGDVSHLLAKPAPPAPINTEGKDEIPNAPNCYNLYESFIWQDGFKAGYAASKSSAEKEIGERKFTLKEALDIYFDGHTDYRNSRQYFKDKFGIDI